MRLFVAALAICFGLFAAAARAQQPVDLELVLAVDVSRSMDFDEQLIQRKGYAEAFRSREVIGAITSGLHGSIAVTYMEWAASSLTRVIVPWTVIDSEASSLAFADALDQQLPQRLSRTSISGAMDAAEMLFADSGFSGMRRVVDISGDGPNNEGLPVTVSRDRLVGNGIIINGLPLMVRPSSYGYGITNLDEYYEDCVIGGPGSFMIGVRNWDEFPQAVRRKLVLEIAGSVPRVERAALMAPVQDKGRPTVDCLVGERIWQQRMRGWEWR
ncbi:MAG: DUF1194 domain-containing protein [Nitratireductor sp.]|nr:DUF1194 domain-containing protein [Nitratireductor sp.]